MDFSAAHADGVLISCDEAGACRLWAADSGELIAELQAPAGELACLNVRWVLPYCKAQARRAMLPVLAGESLQGKSAAVQTHDGQVAGCPDC